MKRRTKYRAVRTTIDGLTFDSKAEARVYQQLRVRERLGEIVRLECQVPFRLAVNGDHVAAFIADMTYVVAKSGEFVVVDVKSEFTRKLPVYRLKRKLFRACYGWDIHESCV